jgi:hypothetical protein
MHLMYDAPMTLLLGSTSMTGLSSAHSCPLDHSLVSDDSSTAAKAQSSPWSDRGCQHDICGELC